jgi:PhnB protein
MAIQIGHTLVTLREAATRLAAVRKTPVVWVEDVDGAFQRALDEGATPVVLPHDQPSGGRTASFIDPQGNRWRIVSQKTRLTDAEVERRLAEQRKNRL